MRDEIREERQRVSLLARQMGCCLSAIVLAWPAVIGKACQTAIILLNRVGPLILPLVSARDRQLQFRHQRRVRRALAKLQEHRPRPRRIPPAADLLSAQQHRAPGVQAVGIPGPQFLQAVGRGGQVVPREPRAHRLVECAFEQIRSGFRQRSKLRDDGLVVPDRVGEIALLQLDVRESQVGGAQIEGDRQTLHSELKGGLGFRQFTIPGITPSKVQLRLAE